MLPTPRHACGPTAWSPLASRSIRRIALVVSLAVDADRLDPIVAAVRENAERAFGVPPEAEALRYGVAWLERRAARYPTPTVPLERGAGDSTLANRMQGQFTRRLQLIRNAIGAACLLLVSAANAYTDASPLTFSVEADSDYPFCCSVYQGPVITSAAYSDLFIRGMVEFDLRRPLGYGGEPVYLSFSFLGSSSLSSSPFASPVSIGAYVGDNLAARPDYGVATFASLGVFQTADLVAGTRLSYDVTSLFQYATRAGAPALGFRLAVAGATGGPTHSATFGNFALTPAVPEPAEYMLMLAGMSAIGGYLRLASSRRRRGCEA